MSPIIQSLGNASARGYGAFFGAAAATDFDSIATVTVGSGGAANVEFTSIPSTYTHLQIRGIAKSDNNGSLDNLQMQFNSDTAANYKSHFLYGTGSTVGAGVAASDNLMLASRVTGGNSSYANIFGSFVIDILDYANTNKYKVHRSLSGHDENGLGEIFFESGLWRNTNAITSIKLYAQDFNWKQYSHFALYGIKGA
jgi:hypothetical protein